MISHLLNHKTKTWEETPFDTLQLLKQGQGRHRLVHDTFSTNPRRNDFPCWIPNTILPMFWTSYSSSQLGKTLVAAQPIKAGQKLQESDLVAKVAEPRGVSAHRLETLVGGYLNRDVEQDESIMEADVLWGSGGCLVRVQKRLMAL